MLGSRRRHRDRERCSFKGDCLMLEETFIAICHSGDIALDGPVVAAPLWPLGKLQAIKPRFEVLSFDQ